MKTTKKELDGDMGTLEAIIAGGKAETEKSENKKGKGRPKSSVTKKQCIFYLPENVFETINEHCEGNRSYFADKVFRYYFDAHKIEY